MKKVLVICDDNSILSQMAEGWLNYYGGSDIEVSSAGIVKADLNMHAVAAMSDAVIDITGHTAKSIEDFKEGSFDFIITLTKKAERECPDFKITARRISYYLPGMGKKEGSEMDIDRYCMEVRDLLEDIVFDFINENIKDLIPDDLTELHNDGK